VADAVDELTSDYLDLIFETFPTVATVFGRHEHDARMEFLTDEGLDGFARKLAELRRRVTAVAPADEEEAVDRDALAAAISDALLVEELERPWRRNPFEAATAVPAAILLLVARDFAPLEQRLADATKRLEAAPAFLERAKALLDQPCPALWRRMAVGAAGGGAGFLAGTLGPLAAGTRLAGRVEAAAAAAAQALGDFAGWLDDEHAARFPEDAPFAIGEAAQARKLREVHCFATSPAEFVRIGEAQIAELTAALTEQGGKLGGKDWAAKLDELKGDHPDADGLLAAYQRELERLESFVFREDLATNPDAAARVEATPEFLRPILGFAAYLPAGPFDHWQQGYFWVTPPPDEAGLRDHSRAMIPAVAAHEGYPGHHLQMTSVNRLASPTRRAIRSAVMIEGWGLYTEQLMHDVGYYDDAGQAGPARHAAAAGPADRARHGAAVRRADLRGRGGQGGVGGTPGGVDRPLGGRPLHHDPDPAVQLPGRLPGAGAAACRLPGPPWRQLPPAPLPRPGPLLRPHAPDPGRPRHRRRRRGRATPRPRGQLNPPRTVAGGRRAGGARAAGPVGLGRSWQAELGRRRWRVGELPSAGC
jgi:hypothetical protein